MNDKLRGKMIKTVVALSVMILGLTSAEMSVAAPTNMLNVPTAVVSETHSQLYAGKIPEYLYFYGQERDLQQPSVKESMKLFQLKTDLSSGEWGSGFELPEIPPISGIETKSVPYERKDRDILVNGIKIFTLTNEELLSLSDEDSFLNPLVRDLVYEIQTPDNRLFYYMKSGIGNNSDFSKHNVLIEVKSGRIEWQTEVYGQLQYVTSDVWRSIRHNLMGSSDEVIQHEKGKKEKNYSQLITKNIMTSGLAKDIREGDLFMEGYIGDHLIFGLLMRDSKGNMTDEKCFVEATIAGQVKLRPERINCHESCWILKGHIYVLTKDGQVIRDLTANKSHYLNGSSKNLGSITLEKGNLLMGKVPIYRYRGFEYLRLIDLKTLGYTVKWDSKRQTEFWTYKGKRTKTVPKLKCKVVYDSLTLVNVEGRYMPSIQVDGYTFVRRNEIEVKK